MKTILNCDHSGQFPNNLYSNEFAIIIGKLITILEFDIIYMFLCGVVVKC